MVIGWGVARAMCSFIWVVWPGVTWFTNWEWKRNSMTSTCTSICEQFIFSCYSWQVSADQRGRLLMSTERLNQSSDRIKESRKTMLETEDIGASILQDLHQQRQSLLHAHNTVCSLLHAFLCMWACIVIENCNQLMQLHGVDDYIGKSKRILTTMSKRMNRNKWIIGSVIAALVLAIIIVLYFKLFHWNNNLSCMYMNYVDVRVRLIRSRFCLLCLVKTFIDLQNESSSSSMLIKQ